MLSVKEMKETSHTPCSEVPAGLEHVSTRKKLPSLSQDYLMVRLSSVMTTDGPPLCSFLPRNLKLFHDESGDACGVHAGKPPPLCF